MSTNKFLYLLGLTLFIVLMAFFSTIREKHSNLFSERGKVFLENLTFRTSCGRCGGYSKQKRAIFEVLSQTRSSFQNMRRQAATETDTIYFRGPLPKTIYFPEYAPPSRQGDNYDLFSRGANLNDEKTGLTRYCEANGKGRRWVDEKS